MRHLAWLSVTPEKAEKPRRESYHEDSPYLQLISLTDYELHLVGLWQEAGSVGQGAGGLTPLAWSEVVSWSDKFYSEESLEWVQSPTKRWMPVVSKTSTLLDYELKIVRDLSQEYCSEYADTSSHRECPKYVEADEVDSLMESTAMGDALMSMFGSGE